MYSMITILQWCKYWYAQCTACTCNIVMMKCFIISSLQYYRYRYLYDARFVSTPFSSMAPLAPPFVMLCRGAVLMLLHAFLRRELKRT
jgi:hypothetical protein